MFKMYPADFVMLYSLEKAQVEIKKLKEELRKCKEESLKCNKTREHLLNFHNLKF